MDEFLKMEINVIMAIQSKLYPFERLFGGLSTVFGPTFLYNYFIPLFAAFNTRIYHRLLISCITSDFICLILKWILNEARPFWWIQETTMYTSLTRPILYQTDRTCETSGGSPSGHMMISSCFLFIVYEELNSIIDAKVSKQTHNIMLRILNRICVIVLLTLIATSRMYFSAHFLHQCILGCVLGILMAKLMSVERFDDIIIKYRKWDWTKLGLCMTTMVVTIYWAHKLLSGNPMQTVHMAFQHCANPLFPSPDTTVVFSSIRCIAMIFGIMMNAPIEKKLSEPDPKKSIPMVLLLLAAQGFAISNTPKNYKIVVFYCYTIVAYALYQFFFIFLIPKYCSKPDKIKTN